MGVFQWVWFKKSEHHSIMWEDFNRHRKKSNKILFEWWYFLSIFICIFYIGLSLFCEKILKCHFFLFFPAIFSPVSFNLLNGIQKKYYFYIQWNISIYKFTVGIVFVFWVSSVWPPGLNAFESIVIYDRNAQLFQSFLGQLKKNITPNCFFCSIWIVYLCPTFSLCIDDSIICIHTE